MPIGHGPPVDDVRRVDVRLPLALITVFASAVARARTEERHDARPHVQFIKPVAGHGDDEGIGSSAALGGGSPTCMTRQQPSVATQAHWPQSHSNFATQCSRQQQSPAAAS